VQIRRLVLSMNRACRTGGTPGQANLLDAIGDMSFDDARKLP